jgi:hypothetical protein
VPDTPTQLSFDSIPIPTTALGLLREARLSADLARGMPISRRDESSGHREADRGTPLATERFSERFGTIA